ncbi:MAG: UDP-N-acetylmuramoyl-L-alanine--D-glutamate ligase [Porticoccus sp.]|nr:UDP-N-acetylmuramoyl-L-alanine--D-glutamate ligase [Porticoccus sp.]
MSQLIASTKTKIVIGIGATGFSIARHLTQLGQHFIMMDTREEPPLLEKFITEFPGISLSLGELSVDSLSNADEIIISPGLSRKTEAVQVAIESNIPVINDIELFARSANAPIVAITGSNGKSTVTTLLGQMFIDAGYTVGIGGNLGTPALDLLDEEVAFYILELSSFQLESISSLCAEAATVLNISPDHMDRYDSLLDYHQSKHRIFNGARQVIINRDDKLSIPLVGEKVKTWSYGLSTPDLNSFGVITSTDNKTWLAYEFDKLISRGELGMSGSHNMSNALAALALGRAVNLPFRQMIETLRRFRGLPHRFQTVRVLNNITYINDSKATNIAATAAAINSLPTVANIILILGGQSKGQNFSVLFPILSGSVKHVLLIGEAASEIENAIVGKIETSRVKSIESAILLCRKISRSGDAVLFSPGCGSLDMFANFEERGEKFISVVEGLQ